MWRTIRAVQARLSQEAQRRENIHLPKQRLPDSILDADRTSHGEERARRGERQGRAVGRTLQRRASRRRTPATVGELSQGPHRENAASGAGQKIASPCPPPSNLSTAPSAPPASYPETPRPSTPGAGAARRSSPRACGRARSRRQWWEGTEGTGASPPRRSPLTWRGYGPGGRRSRETMLDFRLGIGNSSSADTMFRNSKYANPRPPLRCQQLFRLCCVGGVFGELN